MKKLYCVIMSIIGLLFIFLIAYNVTSNNPNNGYNYTTSGENIHATYFDKNISTKQLTKWMYSATIYI